MKEKDDTRRTAIFWQVAFGMAAVGFFVTWTQPAGPLAALPFALLAIWLRRRASTAPRHELAPAPVSREL